jgi:DNA-binding MarR family transcriptional regulator
MARSGADLALLMLGGFRVLAERGRVELAARGYEDVRPGHDFALHAILTGADTASDLGRRMSVTKQAAAETIATLQARGYIEKEPHPSDRRRMRLRVTEKGLALMREGEAVFDELRRDWESQVGAAKVAELEETLRQLVGEHVVRPGFPGSATEEISR